MNNINPEAFYPSPSPSSHASSILRAILQPPGPSAVPVKLAPADACDAASSVDDTPSPRVYRLYGLDDSTIGSSDGDSVEPAYKRLEPLVLPQPPRSTGLLHLIFTGKLPEVPDSDIFGPIRRARLQCYTQRRQRAELSARVKNLRTAAWVRQIRKDGARGGFLDC